jgi:hypothetical protein
MVPKTGVVTIKDVFFLGLAPNKYRHRNITGGFFRVYSPFMFISLGNGTI